MGSRILKLDYDNGERLTDGDIISRLARAGFRTVKVDARLSPSGKGYHVRVQVEPDIRTPMETVALQAICGSDPFREASNFKRARVLSKVAKWWQVRWNVLYRASGKSKPRRHRSANNG